MTFTHLRVFPTYQMIYHVFLTCQKQENNSQSQAPILRQVPEIVHLLYLQAVADNVIIKGEGWKKIQ